MSNETLHTAARRVLNYINIDLNKGGLITEDTQKALSTLEKMVNRASPRPGQLILAAFCSDDQLARKKIEEVQNALVALGIPAILSSSTSVGPLLLLEE